MASLKISNHLGDSSDPSFQFRKNEGSTWDNIIPYRDFPLDDLPNSFEYRFRISKRIHNSSIAVSLKGFAHTIELVDKCQGPDDYTLLRFVPKPDDDNDPDILVEALSSPKVPAANSFTSSPCTEISFTCFKYQRDAKLRKTGPIGLIQYLDGLIFSAQCSCKSTNVTHIGALSPKETLDIYLEGARPKNCTQFDITTLNVGNKFYRVWFFDCQNYQNGRNFPYIPHIHIPHIGVILQSSVVSPENVNITIKGDE